MSLLRFPARTEERMTIDALAALARASRMSYGSTVDEESSMRHDAVWSCRTQIAQDVSMMPVDVIRKTSDGSMQEVQAPQIIAAPSIWVRAGDWRYQVIDSWLGWGNAFGLVTEISPNFLYPTRIELLKPSDVTPKNGAPGVFLIHGVGEERLWPSGRLWHVPAFTVSGELLGLSPIKMHAATISGGLAAAGYGKGFFDGGGHPTAIIAPGVDPGPERAQDLKDRFVQALQGSREPIVLPKDTTYIPLQTNPDDSQFLDTQRYSVEQVCRIFGEDPADHGASGSGSAITYANRTDAELARYKRRLFWVRKLQDALTELIPRPQQVRLNSSVTLQMTPIERHGLYKTRLDSKTITVNEIRLLENEPTFDGDEYDEPGIPGSSSDAMEPDDDDSTDDDPTPPARTEFVFTDTRSASVPTVTVHNHVPEGRDIVVPAPEVVVENVIPEQRAEPSTIQVNVEPTPVTIANTVDVNPTPVTIENRNQIDVAPAKVPPAQVTVMPDERGARFKVRRDGKGQISEVIED